MSIENKKVLWVQFAVGAMRECIASKIANVPAVSSAMADQMTAQWDIRFGDGAFMLEGQSECATCHKPLPEGAPYMPSVDGVKFCNEACLKTSGREE